MLRNNLALAYRAAGRTAEAIALLEQALADRERLLGTDHPDTLASRNNLAIAYRAAGRTAEAIPLHEQALADRERLLATDHPRTLASRNNLAAAYEDAGRTAEATALYEQALADSERVLGTDHPDTLASRNNLAMAYQDAGARSRRSRSTSRPSPTASGCWATDHPRTPDIAEQPRGRVRGRGAHGRGDRAPRAGPRRLRARAGHRPPDTLISRNNLAMAYQDAGRTVEAIALLEQALADSERLLGTDHPNTKAVRCEFGRPCWREPGAAVLAPPPRICTGNGHRSLTPGPGPLAFRPAARRPAPGAGIACGQLSRRACLYQLDGPQGVGQALSLSAEVRERGGNHVRGDQGPEFAAGCPVSLACALDRAVEHVTDDEREHHRLPA